jgi:hypothetical protein
LTRTREAGGVLHQHRPNAIAFDPVEEGGEAGARLDGICATHAGVVELFLDVEACSMCKPADRAKEAMAARWRRSQSLSEPTLAMEEVRR